MTDMILVEKTGNLKKTMVKEYDENTLYKKENPKEGRERSQVNPTGKNTLDLLKSLNEILEILEKKISEEKL